MAPINNMTWNHQHYFSLFCWEEKLVMAQTSFIFALVCVALRSCSAEPIFPGNIVSIFSNPKRKNWKFKFQLPNQRLCCEVSDCGPCPSLGPILTMCPVFLNPVDGPIVDIPAPAPPPPVVISNKCTCQKTVLKPQLFQRLIQTQTNQRFLKKTYNPVVEKIAYRARPRC